MSIIYDKEEQKVVDTDSGRCLELKRAHYQSSSFDYIFRDGDQSYKLGLYKSYCTVDPKTRNSPLKKAISHVDTWVVIDDNGVMQNSTLLQRYSGYKKYKADIERLLIGLGAGGKRVEDLEFDIIVDFSSLDKAYKSAGIVQPLFYVPF